KAELGHAVDELLTLPCSRAELLVRVGSLLRLRDLSHQQENTHGKLANIMGSIRDLNARKLQREREHQSTASNQLTDIDALTGLPNRRYLINYLQGMFADTQRATKPSAAILFVDLDDFKLINDVMGHEAGNDVLIQVSQRLRSAVRDTDLVVRQGGDEFLVVILDAPRKDPPLTPKAPEEFVRIAQHLANRVIDHLKEPIVIGGQEHHLSASIGISLCPDHGRNASTVIQAADTAMYAAKKQGYGESFLYSIEMFTKRRERLSLKARLRTAIEQEKLALHYQPIVDMNSGRMVATEALVRWPQSSGEIIMPETFVSIAEESGLIKPMGDWVLETAARQLNRWHQAGHMLRMTINLSVHQLYPEGDPDRIAAIVRRYVDPVWVTLEITESVLMIDPTTMERVLNQLHGHGFRIAIDDFGTGYSSLSRLQHLPVQLLKIDRSFVAKLDQADRGAAMIPIIQQMAVSFDLEIIAEGIENRAQYEYLCATDIKLGQGFWFGRPVPASQIRHHQRLPGPGTAP
ncbi:MAG: EAL domain-containing protein, partial [Oleiphilaceae bacterium]|nr:EAL domain-containing protein [Oleiphilaceae bacterium]